MNFKAIFWDNDGILVDTEPLFARAIAKIFENIGYGGNAEELYLQYNVKKGINVFQEVQKEIDLTDEEVEILRDERDDYYYEFLKTDLKIIPGVEEVLETLYKKFPMAVVTSSLPEHFRLIHEQTGFLKYFQFVVSREQFRKSKPDPECYLHAAEKMQINPEDCLVIEDSERGLIAAKEAGMTCFVIPTEFTKPLDFSRADRVLQNISELPETLQNV